MVSAKKFRVGQEVKLVRALGERSSHGAGQYYYAGTPKQVPLSSFGTIDNIDGERIRLKLANSSYTDQWTVHPDEIKSLTTDTIAALQGIERLERHPLFEMSATMPLVVIEGKVYAQGEKVSEESKPTTFLVDERNDISRLEEIGTLESLDEMHVNRNETVISELQTAYSAEVWSKLGLEKRLGAINSQDFPSLLAATIFPYFKGAKYQDKITGILGANQQEVSSEESRPSESRERNLALEKVLGEILGDTQNLLSDLDSEALFDEDVKVADERNAKQKKIDALLGVDPLRQDKLYSQPLENQNFIISNGQISYLSPMGGKNRRVVNVNGTEYKLEDSAESLEQVESDQRRLISQEIRKRTLETVFSKEKVKDVLNAKIGDISKFAGLKEYDGGEFGFTTKGSYSYLWLKVPQFAIKSPYDGNCYLFAESKVGVTIGLDSGRVCVTTSGAYMVKNNRHPLTEDDQDYRSLCFGKNDIVEGNYGKDIVKRLRQAKEVVMQGYKGSMRLYSHRRLGQCNGDNCYGVNHYRDLMTDERELMRRGIPIFDGGAA